MHAKKWLMIFIILIGGIAVLGSYAIGILTHPDAGQTLWGRVPQSIRPFYTTGMFLAATGYFAFTYFILFRQNPLDTHIANRLGFGLFNIFYSIILVPSALWMPLTFLAVEQASPGLLWLVRIDLWVVATASLSLLLALLNVEPRQPRWAHRLAIVGSLGFCLQTVVFDALVWVTFFHL
jgi:hypothetical protein